MKEIRDYDKNGKIKILNMIKLGYSHKEISDVLGLSKNTISSFIRRNNSNENEYCLNCGNLLIQSKGHRQKKYCCDSCRKMYLKKHHGDKNE